MAHSHRHLCALAAALLAAPGPYAAGQMPLPAGEEEGAAAALDAAAVPLDAEALLVLLGAAGTVDEAIEVRARLIEVAGADDDRAATWMVEQAAALLDRLAADGADAAVIFGIPTSRQRQAAEEDGAGAMVLIARAQDAAVRAVERVQAELIDGTGDPETVRRRAERAERTLARLVDLEQGVRIPFFRGRAAVILAALESGRAGREEFARVALESLGKLRLGTVAAEASRRVSLGAVLLLIGSGNEQPREQAKELLRWVVEQPARGEGAGGAPDPVIRAQAWMGLMRAAGTIEELRTVREALALAAITEPFRVVAEGSVGRTADPLLALLTAEGAARAMLLFPARDAADQARHLDEAFGPLLTLLERADLREHRQSLRPRVLAKVGGATDRLMPLEKMHASIAFARAVTLARREGSADGPMRAEAAALLEMVAARGDAGAARPEALWELAVILWESGRAADGVRAVEALCRLAGEFPDSVRAAESAAKAVEMARYLLAQFSSSPPAEASLPARLTELYARALELAVKLAPADADSAQQRLERARIVLDAAAAGNAQAMTPEELDAALSALEGVAESDPRRAQADAMAAAGIDRALAAAQEAVVRAAAADEGGAAVLAPAARERLIAVARRAVQWAQERRPADADRYRLALAEAMLGSGDARAAAIYQDLVDRGGAGGGAGGGGAAGAEMRLRAQLGLGRSLRAAGQSEEAFALLRGVVDELERAAAKRRPPTAERHEVYWLAWAEMLEILAADNRDGRRTETIQLRVNRLALVDPRFGGGEAGKRIEAVRGTIQPR